MTSEWFDEQTFEAWLGSLPVAAADSLHSWQAIAAIVALGLAMGILAFIVAGFSETGNETASTSRFIDAWQAAADGSRDWIGATCAWVCQWHPSGTTKRHPAT